MKMTRCKTWFPIAFGAALLLLIVVTLTACTLSPIQNPVDNADSDGDIITETLVVMHPGREFAQTFIEPELHGCTESTCDVELLNGYKGSTPEPLLIIHEFPADAELTLWHYSNNPSSPEPAELRFSLEALLDARTVQIFVHDEAKNIP